ncbi:MAG: glycosyltransferase family 39 protein, partial [Acidobacteriota bacterium]|nr:glycosyltransferase family 39 protein [Acidobacteriota bacterium]
MRLRAIFLVITSLSVLWIYVLVVVWRGAWVEALLAGLFLALSWEVAYHLRWVATDGMLMQFGALTLLCVMLSRVRPLNGRFWLQLAAVAAGLGCGTKYPGGLLFIPVLVAGYLHWDRKSPSSALIWLWVKLALIFAGVYLATTPATVLQPGRFLAGLSYELHHYSTGHAGHTVSPGLEHGWRMFVYFSSVLFSRYAPIAWLFFLLGVVGGYALVKEDRRTATLFLCFPVLYLLYFCTQRAMVVRNLLVVVPFMAVLAARGTIFIWQGLRLGVAGRAVGSANLSPVQLGFAALMLTAFSINAGWLVYAAQTIAERNTDRFVREAAAYISGNNNQQFFLSPRVRAHLTTVGPAQLPNVTDDPARADEVILYAHEGMRRWQDWPANRFWLATTWFGPYEVNFNAYPNWWGDDRIIIVPTARAKQIGILVVK